MDVNIFQCTNNLPWLPQDEMMAKVHRRVKNQKNQNLTQTQRRINLKAENSEEMQILSLENCIESGNDELDGVDSLTCFGDKDNSFIMSVLASPEQFDDIFGDSKTGIKDNVLDFSKL